MKVWTGKDDDGDVDDSDLCGGATVVQGGGKLIL